MFTLPEMICQNGTAVMLLWEQGGHVWAQFTRDGMQYEQSNGVSDPLLVSNASTEDARVGVQPDGSLLIVVCGEDANGDAIDSVVVWFENDRDGDVRLLLRTGAVPR